MNLPARILIIAFLSMPSVPAQKAPEAAYVFPPVVNAGATASVVVGGFDFTQDMQFFVHNAKVKLTPTGPLGEFIVPGPPYWFGEKSRATAFPIPREIPAQISVAADCPEGLIHWQVANAAGGSATAVFMVSHQREIQEFRFRNETQNIDSLPLGISGRLERIAEIDRYRIRPVKDGPVTVELFARRLGSPFNGLVEIRDANGRVLADTADTQGIDATLTFQAKGNSDYTINLHDVDFRGNRAFVYRLNVWAGPRLITSVPAQLAAGRQQNVRLIGFDVADSSPGLQAVERTVDVPNEKTSVAVPVGDGTGSLRVPVGVPEGVNIQTYLDSTTDSNVLTSPCRLTAVMDADGEQDFLWAAEKGRSYHVAAAARALGTPLDVALTVFTVQGKQLATNDDLAGTPDAELYFTAPEDGEYVCVVRDMAGRGGQLNSVYQLSITESEPDFSLDVPQTVNIPSGGKTSLKVTINRTAGHKEDILLRVRGLPKGVSVPAELKIPGKSRTFDIPLEAAADAQVTAGLIQIEGVALAGDEAVDSQTQKARPVLATAAGNLCPQNPQRNKVAGILLAMTLKPRFRVLLTDRNRQRAVHRGTTYPAPFVIERDAGFTGEIRLQMAARQGRHRQGITGPVVAIPTDATHVNYPCSMPEWLETDRTTRMVVMGVGAQRDPTGVIRYIPAPADARITMILEGALLKIAQTAHELTVPPGHSFEVPVRISRSTKLRAAVSMELRVPEPLKQLVTMEKSGDISVDQEVVVVKVHTVADNRLSGRWPLQIVATALQDGKWPVVSQTEVHVEFEGHTQVSDR